MNASMNVLIPFDLIVDIDMGLAKLIYFQYNNKDFFNTQYIENDNLIKQLLLFREEENPLHEIYKYPDDFKTINDLYQQFMTKEYKNILSVSNNTDLIKLLFVSNMNKDKLVIITVLCKSQDEVNILAERNIPCEIIIEPDKSKIDLSKYQSIYVKNLKDLDLYNDKQLYSKNIFVANYGFNVMIEPKTKMILLNISKCEKYIKGRHNDFYIFSLYSFNTLEELPKELKEEQNNGNK